MMELPVLDAYCAGILFVELRVGLGSPDESFGLFFWCTQYILGSTDIFLFHRSVCKVFLDMCAQLNH